MDRPKYDNVDEARLGLISRGVPGDDIDRLFDALDLEAEKVVERYDFLDEVDLDEINDSLRIGCCMTTMLFIDERMWDAEGCVDRAVESIRRHETDVQVYASSGSHANRSTYLLYAEMMRERHVRNQ